MHVSSKFPPSSSGRDLIVTDDLIARLHRATPQGIAEVASGLGPHHQAQLAVFCYGRSHLHDTGLTIATLCDPQALIDIAGPSAKVMLAQAAQREQAADRPLSGRRPKISLASFGLTKLSIPGAAADDDLDDVDGLDDLGEVLAVEAPTLAAGEPAEAARHETAI